VSIAQDDAGAEAWEVKVFKAAQPLESFSDQPTGGRHVVV
jgi:hypothetical protein